MPPADYNLALDFLIPSAYASNLSTLWFGPYTDGTWMPGHMDGQFCLAQIQAGLWNSNLGLILGNLAQQHGLDVADALAPCPAGGSLHGQLAQQRNIAV